MHTTITVYETISTASLVAFAIAYGWHVCLGTDCYGFRQSDGGFYW